MLATTANFVPGVVAVSTNFVNLEGAIPVLMARGASSERRDASEDDSSRPHAQFGFNA
jgi:hypothetical protein